MLYWLTEFSDGGDFFNLFRYITFRAGMAFATALIFGFLFGRGPSADKDLNDAGDGDRQNHPHQAEVESTDTDCQQDKQGMQPGGRTDHSGID